MTPVAATPMAEPLSKCWEVFLATGDASPLLAYVQEQGSSETTCNHPYPFQHRIADVALNGRTYRLSRCITCGECLRITPISAEIAQPHAPGVPYSLTGEPLRAWVEKEQQRPAKGPTDWTAFGPAARVPTNGPSSNGLQYLFQA